MIGTVKMVAFDAHDHRALAAFYGALLRGRQSYDDDDWVTLLTPDGRQIGFQHAPDHVTPRWPDPAYPQQMHICVEVDDIAAAEPLVLELGARRLDGAGDNWRVYADPAGHPFCLTW